jgi:hypothetical protein
METYIKRERVIPTETWTRSNRCLTNLELFFRIYLAPERKYQIPAANRIEGIRNRSNAPSLVGDVEIHKAVQDQTKGANKYGTMRAWSTPAGTRKTRSVMAE